MNCKWVDSNKELPYNTEDVLVYNQKDKLYEIAVVLDEELWEGGDGYVFDTLNTFWTPLPPPPKGD